MDTSTLNECAEFDWKIPCLSGRFCSCGLCRWAEVLVDAAAGRRLAGDDHVRHLDARRPAGLPGNVTGNSKLNDWNHDKRQNEFIQIMNSGHDRGDGHPGQHGGPGGPPVGRGHRRPRLELRALQHGGAGRDAAQPEPKSAPPTTKPKLQQRTPVVARQEETRR